MRKRRALTLPDAIVALVVLTMIASMSYTGGASILRGQGDAEVRNVLVQLVAAQHIRHDTVGSYASSPDELVLLLDDVVAFVGPNTASAEPGQVSVLVQRVGGEDVVIAAAQGTSRRCYVVRSHEPASRVPDERLVLAGASCTAQAGYLADGGEPW
jgi:hypothetical protein